MGGGILPGQIGTIQLDRQKHRMLVRRREPRVEGDGAVEGLECRAGRSPKRRIAVNARITQPVPDLGVLGVAVGGVLQS